jgi:hypothetical protein
MVDRHHRRGSDVGRRATPCLQQAKLKVGEAPYADGTSRGKHGERTQDEPAQPTLNV